MLFAVCFRLLMIVSAENFLGQLNVELLLWQVVVLRSLRSKLAEALAEVHSTASSLHLRVVRHEDGHGMLASSAGGNSHTEQLFQQARKAIIQTSNSCSDVISKAFEAT